MSLTKPTSEQVTYDPSGTGAVATTVQAKLRESVSVIDFGADPTGVADSTAEIQAAFATGKSVLIPDGTYKITTTIDIATAGQRIQFESRNAILSCATDFTAITVSASFVEISSGKIVGAAAAATSTTAGIKIVDCAYGKFDHIYITKFGYGFQMYGAVTHNWGNQLQHLYLLMNYRAGIYGCGYNTTIVGGENSGSAFGILQCPVQAGGTLAIDKDSTGTIGDMSIYDMSFESMAAVGGVGGTGIYVGNGNMSPAIYGGYCEAVASFITLGSKFKNNGSTPHTSPVVGGEVRGVSSGATVTNFIVVGYCLNFSATANNISDAATIFIDSDAATAQSQISVIGNYVAGGDGQWYSAAGVAMLGTVIDAPSGGGGIAFQIRIPTALGSTTLTPAMTVANNIGAAYSIYFPGSVLTGFLAEGVTYSYSTAVVLSGATPTATYSFHQMTNGGATTVTNITGVGGQRLEILFTDGNSTLQHGANFKLAGGANFVSSANDIIVLRNVANVWYEVSRSVNG